MNNNIAALPIQNPWAWVGMGMGIQCRALPQTEFKDKARFAMCLTGPWARLYYLQALRITLHAYQEAWP
jgi:hypothetical protein